MEQPPLPAKNAALEAFNSPQAPVVEYYQTDQLTDFEPDLSKEQPAAQVLDLQGTHFAKTLEAKHNVLTYGLDAIVATLQNGNSDYAAFNLNPAEVTSIKRVFNQIYGNGYEVTAREFSIFYQIFADAYANKGTSLNRALKRRLENVVLSDSSDNLYSIRQARNIPGDITVIIINPDSGSAPSRDSVDPRTRTRLRIRNGSIILNQDIEWESGNDEFDIDWRWRFPL